MTPEETVVVRQLLDLVVERVHGPGVDDIVKRAEAALASPCTCTPCTSGGTGHPLIQHCAACCFGTLIEEYDHNCPEPEHRAMAATQFPAHSAAPKTGADLADQRRRERETGTGPFGDDPLSTAERMGAADEQSQFAECARCGHQYQNHVGLDGTRCNAGEPCLCTTFVGPGGSRG